MKTLIERVLDDSKLAASDVDHVVGAREKISLYLETLISAGQRDARRLKQYARAYLHELRDGPDRRFTGC